VGTQQSHFTPSLPGSRYNAPAARRTRRSGGDFDPHRRTRRTEFVLRTNQAESSRGSRGRRSVGFLVKDKIVFVDREPPYGACTIFGGEAKRVIRAVLYREGFSLSDVIVTRKITIGGRSRGGQPRHPVGAVTDKSDVVGDLAKGTSPSSRTEPRAIRDFALEEGRSPWRSCWIARLDARRDTGSAPGGAGFVSTPPAGQGARHRFRRQGF
jgi:hypothetical protein